MKALLIVPHFFGYENSIKTGLESKGYQVDLIDSEQQKTEYWNCWEKDLIHKGLRHILPGQRERDRKKADSIFGKKYLECILKQIERDENGYSLILTVKGDMIQDSFYEYLKKKNPNAKYLLYLWDDAKLLHRVDYFHYFDQVYSYNIEDCRQYKWKYLPIFTQISVNNNIAEKEYDIAIIGTGHKERVKIAKKIYERYKDKYTFFIYLLKKDGMKNDFFAKDIGLSYHKYFEILRKSKAVLDIPLNGQKGPTTRVFDACITRTKVITINRSIIKYPVYGRNIQIINKHRLKIPECFVNEPYIDEGKQMLDVNEWIEKILC